MSRFVGFLLLCFVAHNGAFKSNLRSEGKLSEDKFKELLDKQKEHSQIEAPIPDPTCKKGVMSPDMKVCCSDECGSCGNHPLCDDLGKFNEATGKLADNCCKNRISEKALSCDKNHPPCVLSASYKKSIENYVIPQASRHAMQDCGKAKQIAQVNHALGIDKGQVFASLYLGRTKYQDAKAIAVKVSGLCTQKTAESKKLEDEYSVKIQKATAADKKKDPLSGLSTVMQWEDARDNEKAEVTFYKMILGNAKSVDGNADKGIANERSLKALIEKKSSTDFEDFVLKADALIDDAEKVFANAKELWKQWMDSSKDYPCSAPPAASHAASQCTEGNTKFSSKCSITCAVGYDGEGTQNELRCNKQGKFGKELYGEWQGMAACVGRSCGKSQKISKAKTAVQDIRFPHAASYVCYEGFSTNRDASGAKAFTVPCGAAGNFEQNASHVCKAISCGEAPVLKHTQLIPGEFSYTEVASYKCMNGYTVDGTPGGLMTFSSTCLATGRFTEGIGCQPVRCGPPPMFVHTKLDPPTKEDQYYGASLIFNCLPGYTINQERNGPDHFSLGCQSDGEFNLQGGHGKVVTPKCQPVSAGMAPKIPFGNFNRREMFYGESVLVTADTGYSTSGNPSEGVTFTLTVTTEGTYAGEEKFIPVVCGELSVEKAKTSFSGKAVYGDLISFACEKGHSVDKTDQEASASFSVQCEADASFSRVPGLGKCVNIDDCADHTCGPFGACVDHLMNYTCNCKGGYEQRRDNQTNELVCGNIDDCGPEACGAGECIDLVKGYKCECPVGHENVDEENSDGKMDHTCKVVSCGTPAEVDNAATTPVEDGGEKASYKAKIVYQCDTGYTLDAKPTGKNHFEIECLASKQFTETKTCKPIKCDNVPKVNFSSAEKSFATFNQSVRYACNKGHTVDGTAGGDHGFTVSCQVTGKFGEPQACKPISCGEPDDVPNANRPSGALVYEGSAKYVCLNGFTLDGSKDGKTEFQTECQEDGKLTKLQQCMPKICGEPPKDIHVLYASTKDEGLIRYPHSTEIICRDGYTVGGEPDGKTSFLVSCMASGEFSQVDERTCQPVKCGAPPSMSNATLTKIQTPEPAKPGLSRSVFYMPMGDRIPDLSRKVANMIDVVADIDFPSSQASMPGLSQKDNFALQFSGALMIKKGGEYQFELTSDDGSILYINGNKVVNNDGLHGMTAKTGKVELGAGPHALTVDYFEKGGGAGMKLKWKGPDAGSWQVIPQAALQTKGGNLNYEEKAMYKCLPGFTTGGEIDAPTTYRVECLPSGQLSAPSEDQQCRNVDDCERHTCGPKGLCIDLVGPSPAYTCKCDFGFELQTDANGEKHCGNKNDCLGKDCGVGVCKDLVGDYTCTCPSGYYIGTKDNQKTCIPVQCAAGTPALANGRMLSSHSGAVNFPTTLRYKCDTGYSIDGQVAESNRKFQAQCKGDGSLFGMKGCQKISCGSPYVLSSTNLVVPSSPRRSVEYGDKAKYKCANGFTIGGQANGQTAFEVTCQDDGVLTDPQTCEPVRCGSAPHVPKSRPGIAGFVSFGQHLVYRCDQGYTLDSTLNGRSEFQRQCQSDGTFTALSADAPCKPVSAGNAPVVRNADMTEYAGEAVTSFPPRVYYPEGLEYRCKSGYSTTGSLSGPTKITARVTTRGTLTPSLPSECKKIVFSIRGRVKNARNGRWLNSVKITLEGTNNIVGSSMGFFTLRDIPAGTVNLVYERAGYIKFKKTITLRGNVNSGGVADVSMSPTMRTDQWRAVLKWGPRPTDLDTYGRWGSGRVWYGGMRRSSSGLTGVLEVDQTRGYGPETFYLTGVGRCRGGSSNCDVKYEINDYTRTGSMVRTSDAEVTLYNGNRVAGTWKIADCPNTVRNGGNWWHVFTVDGRTNRLKWSCNSGALGALIQTPSANPTALSSSNLAQQRQPVAEKSGLRFRSIPK